jgi:GT2 family glycosyltransferase
VRLLDNPLRLSSAARARGAAEARGRFVLFVDGHCRVPSPTLLADMLALFERTGADCLARPQPLVAEVEGYVPRAVAAARTSRFGHSVASTIYDLAERPVSPVSAGAMYRREVFEKIGTFDPDFDACEDVEFNWRLEQAGATCWTSDRLAVAYEPRGTLGGLLRQMIRYGRGRARLHRKHPAAFTVESLVPSAFVLGLLLLIASPWLPVPLRTLVLVAYGLYVLIALGAAVMAARARGWALLPVLPIVFFVIHLGLGLGYLVGRLERWPKVRRPEPAC